MTNKLVLSADKNYLHLVLKGKLSQNTKNNIFSNSLEECASLDCPNLLVDYSQCDLSFTSMDAVRFVYKYAEADFNQIRKIGYIIGKNERASIRFFYLVLHSRFSNLICREFQNLQEATRWYKKGL